MKTMKKYVKPLTESIRLEEDIEILKSSNYTQCDCYQHQMYGGCEGCPGGGKVGHTCECGCNHWDPDLGEIIPG